MCEKSGIEKERVKEDGTPYKAIDFEKLIAMMIEVFHAKIDNIMTFKDQSYKSLMTDTEGAPVKVSWMQQLQASAAEKDPKA